MYNETKLMKFLDKIMFKEPPVDKGSQNTTILELFEHIGVLSSECGDLVWTFPQVVEFPMLSFFFTNRVPSQHQIADLEILRLSPYVKDVLYLFLGRLSSVECLFSMLV